MTGEDALLQAARTAAARAYAPYSGYRVGAAVEDVDGYTHIGCNVENASYGLTVCAERVAMAGAVAVGASRPVRLALWVPHGPPATPCGACRQFLAEFVADLPIRSASPEGQQEWSLAELLPKPFIAGMGGSEPPDDG